MTIPENPSEDFPAIGDYLKQWDGTPFFPIQIAAYPDEAYLEKMYLYEWLVEDTDDATVITVGLAWEAGDEFNVSLLSVDGISLVLGSEDVANLTLGLTLQEDGFDLAISTAIRLFFDSTLIRPVSLQNGVYEPLLGESYEVSFGEITLTIDHEGEITLGIGETVLLEPFQIGDTGIVVDPGEVVLCFNANTAVDLADNFPAAGLDANFRGVFIPAGTLCFPEGFPIVSAGIENAFIGTNGFTGSVSVVTGDPNLEERGDFSGFPFTLNELALSFVQNSLTASSIRGWLTLPFFDEPVGVILSLGVDGSLGMALEDTAGDGLFILDIPFLGSFTLSSLGFVTEDGEAGLLLSGILQLEVLSPLLEWPAIELFELRISTGGEVKLPDGWIDLQEPVALDLFGFRLEITRIGFGNTDDGRRWVGFSGGISLVDFLPTGASVEGLRVIWDPAGRFDPEITLQGVGVELTLPGVLQFDGDVAFINEESVSYFQGNAKLKLLPLGIELDASVKIGRDNEEGYKFVYTFMSLTLPIGLPLWATGAALYGIAGLYGMNVNPTAENSDWYGWYAGLPEEFNVTNAGKWKGLDDGKALGAGMTIGTLFDVGRVVSVKGLFALILPGPVIILHGMANFLNVPPDASEPSSQGVFNALMVLDALAGNLQINIDAGWSKAQVIDISASAEAYFDFANPRNWHFYLGQDTPEDRRIRADFIGLFHADAYLMVDMDGIATGASISWGYDWKFGPVKVILRAWIGSEAAITWQPPQLEGSLQVGGEFEISVAGFGIGLSAEAGLSGKAPTLYWVKGELEVSVKLPTPLKDLEETIVLEWHEEAEPDSQDPFRSIGLEHPKVDETWTEVVETNLYDPDSAQYDPGPLVPLDARPSVVFDRSMHDVTPDNAFTSVDVYPGGAQIGNYTFEYELQEVLLEKWSKAGSTGWTAVEQVYGTWMAVEDGGGEPAFTRLQLWAKSPFAFTRQTSRTYRDAFLMNHLDWPCADLPDYTTYCVDWEDIDAGKTYGQIFERGGLQFTLVLTENATVVQPDILNCDTQKALQIDGSWNFMWIVFHEPVHTVELCLGGYFVAVQAYSNGEMVSQQLNPEPGPVGFQSSGIDAIGLWSLDDGLLSRICYLTDAEVSAYTAAFDHIWSVYNGLLRWDSQDEILEPETWYRLTVRQETVRTHNGSSERTPYTHAAHFHTGGPPGLGLGAEPVSETDPDANVPVPYPQGGKLTNLKEYIHWTIPGDGDQPVYRAYDLGAEFNENYIEQMYGADMAIRLLDSNAQPIQDAEGNVVEFPNQWAEQPTAELSETEYPYTSRVEDCLELPDVYYFPDQKILFSNGVLLDEDFSGDLDQWSDPHPEDGGDWVIAAGRLQYGNTFTPLLGALLVAGESDWGDYAVEVTLSDTGENVGVACRYSNALEESYYRLRLDGSGRYLEKVVDGNVSVLWQDSTGYILGESDVLALYCQGARLRGQLDGALLFDLEDEAPLPTGQVGIFTNATAAFEHFLVRVWPGSVLAPQTMYRADLLASYVLFTGGLESGKMDVVNYDWVVLEKNNAHLAAIGSADWKDYRIEVNATVTGQRVGLIARFQQNASSETFSCYRLHLNPDDEKAVLVRLQGTYDGSTFDLDNSGTETVWDCDGEACGIDFGLGTHTLALTCGSDELVVEIDGVELWRGSDLDGLSAGKAGLYYISADDPDFSDLVIRSAPRQPVFGWQYVTSRYAGFVEHLDSFQGLAYREELSGVNPTWLAHKVSTAQAALAAASQALADSRALLASAGPEEITIRRSDTQNAAAAWQIAAAAQFEVLYEEFFNGSYRPLPPVVELSVLGSGNLRYGLLLESPEPLDWQRLAYELRILDPDTGLYALLTEVLAVWSDDGARAIFIPTDDSSLAAGAYELLLVYNLDIGLESPLLRRGGSTLPEIGRLRFTLE